MCIPPEDTDGADILGAEGADILGAELLGADIRVGAEDTRGSGLEIAAVA